MDDAARIYGPLQRLYGIQGLARLQRAHVVVVGLGGVGSWTAEALARSGIGQLTLIDMDHVAESNLNRQVHATHASLGQSKVDAMRQRIAQFNPMVRVDCIDEFVGGSNWPQLLPSTASHVVDACDDFRAKLCMAAWALSDDGRRQVVKLISVGAAGGKQRAECVRQTDLADVSHDPLLAKLRYQVRKDFAAKRSGSMRLACVSSDEPVLRPQTVAETVGASAGSALACHGYGSSVAVTATFGMVAAGYVLNSVAAP